MRKWILPEHVEDVLPAEAEALEALRRRLLDHLAAQGYRLVQPPLIEHLDSLLTGSARDLDLQTFKVVDPMSGRLLGVRADITPQVARIDAHLSNTQGINRFCYAGSVLRATPAPPGMSREVVQLGAELFGEPGIGGDREALGLLVSTLEVAGVARLHLDLGHVGVYRALASGAGIGGGGSEEMELFEAMRAKDLPAVRDLTARLPAAWRDGFAALASLYGPAAEVLNEAARALPDIPAVANALTALAELDSAFASRIVVHVDLADLRGYHYHNGPIFSAFTAGESNAIGNGGRYDGVGRVFGRARPATGFTVDLRHLNALASRS